MLHIQVLNAQMYRACVTLDPLEFDLAASVFHTDLPEGIVTHTHRCGCTFHLLVSMVTQWIWHQRSCTWCLD